LRSRLLSSVMQRLLSVLTMISRRCRLRSTFCSSATRVWRTRRQGRPAARRPSAPGPPLASVVRTLTTAVPSRLCSQGRYSTVGCVAFAARYRARSSMPSVPRPVRISRIPGMGPPVSSCCHTSANSPA